MPELIQKGGLNPTPIDKRDFPVTPVFGAANVSNLPREFVVASPLIIKDQGDTDMCTAYALSSVSEDQEEVILDPFYTFGRTKEITGDMDAWGADLRSACKSGVSKGFRPMRDDQLDYLRTPATREDRDLAADWRAIPRIYDQNAQVHKKKSFVVVDGNNDFFDNVKSALWQLRDQKRSVFTGCNWRGAWTDVKGGIIEKRYDGAAYGHAVKCFGWDLGEYLLFQLSNGNEIGDDGVFKIHREQVNEAFTYGAFTLLDLPRENMEYDLGRLGWFRYWFNSIIS